MITKPTRDEINLKINSDIASNINIRQDVLTQSPIGIISSAFSNSVGEIYDYTEKKILNPLDIDNYSGIELDKIASILNITRNIETIGNGSLFLQGNNGVQIPALSQFSYNGYIYLSQNDNEIQNNILNIVSIIRSGTQATCTTSSQHNLSSGAEVTISDTGEANFDITTPINVISPTSFTFTVANTGLLNVSTGKLAFLGCNVQVLSQEAGSLVNILGDANVEAISITSGIDLCKTTFFGISGGTDTESDISLRSRFKTRLRNYTANYTKDGIVSYIKEKYSEITHCAIVNNLTYTIPILSIEIEPAFLNTFRKITFAKEHPYNGNVGATFFGITGASSPALNIQNGYVAYVYNTTQILVYVGNTNAIDTTSTNMLLYPYTNGTGSVLFYKANSPIKTLSNTELNSIKNDLSNVNSWVCVNNSYIFSNFRKKNYTFTFTNISPHTTFLKTAIKENLVAWAKDLPSTQTQIKQSEYDAIIKQTQDKSGNSVINYDLLVTGDINIALDELFILDSADIIFNI